MRKLLLLAVMAVLLVACGGTTVVYVTPAPSLVPIAIFPVGSGALASPVPSSAPAAGPLSQADLVAATVQIFGYKNASDPVESPVYSGSGTILTADGFILTNAHVGAPDAPGLAVQYQGPNEDPVGKLVVALNQGEDKAPVKMYQASLVASDGYLDAAVLKIDKTADGAPVDPSTLNLPHLALGDSDATHIGDQVTIVGFPGIGGDTVTVDKGDVSGFISDDRIGDRAWIKTSAIVYHGNSGGLAANNAGQIIAIPTRLPDFGEGNGPGGFSLLRPVNLVKRVIDAALNGQDYGISKYVAAGTGQEQMTTLGWIDPSDTGCSSVDPSRALPVGVTRLAAGFGYSGFQDKEDWMAAWTFEKNGETTVLTKSAGLWDAGPSGDCFSAEISYADGFPENTYGVVMFAGPQYRVVGNATTTTGAAPPPTPQPTPAPSSNTGNTGNTGDPVTLVGRILDTTTGKPVAGVLVFVLQPGVDPNEFLKAPTDPQLAAFAKSGADGKFEMDRPLASGGEYPIIIGKKGYQPIIATLTVNGNDLGDVGLTPR